MVKLDVKSISVWRYWIAGIAFIALVWASSIPLMFFQGFFEFLMIEYGGVVILLVYTLCYITIIPYVFGRIVRWVSKKLF